MQKTPVNAKIVMEVFDGQLDAVRDSLQSDIDPSYMIDNGYFTTEETPSETYPSEEEATQQTESYEYY